MADARRLVELGMVPDLAKEVAAQINAGVGDKRRLVELTMVPRLASELAIQITSKIGDKRRLIELGVVGRLALEISSQITGSVALNALRSTNAGFGGVSEFAPNAGIAQTTRAPTPDFLEEFNEFSVTYAVFRVRQVKFTATLSDGSGGAGNILTVSNMAEGMLFEGMDVQEKASTPTYTGYVVAQLTGTEGREGTYQMSASGSLASLATWQGDISEELFAAAGAQITYQAGWLDRKFVGNTGIPARMPITFDGGQSTKTYNFANWDKNFGTFDSDWMHRPGGRSSLAAEIWTRCTLPANQQGLPVNKAVSSQFQDRGWGNDLATTGTSADPITATTIGGVSNSGLSLVITPLAINLRTAGGKKTVIIIADSRGTITGKGLAGEPAGFGDQMGDALGLSSDMERGCYYTAQQHSVLLAKPSDRASYWAKAPKSCRYRQQAAAKFGDSAEKRIVNALGQNDQNTTANPLLVYSSGMQCPVGRAINASNRIYIITVGGVGAASAPVGTDTTQDIAFGTATIRYIGTSTDSNVRQAYGMEGKNLLNNRRIRQMATGCKIGQEGLGPYTTSADLWATATGQSDNFQSAVGIAYQSHLTSGGSVVTGADFVLSTMPLVGGSRTVNGGADDGTRTWKTAVGGNINYFYTGDGIHQNNPSADAGKAGWTNAALQIA